MASYILALDQGTTSSRAIMFDEKQNIIEMAQKELSQYYPKEGWVEHDPMEIYSSQYAVMMEVITQSRISPAEIVAMGVANQRETTILWEKDTGRPVYNAIVWQCRRTASMIEELMEQGYGELIQEKTGLIPDAYFSASKIKWILDNVKGVREKANRGEILFGTVDTWLIWNLTGGKAHITDYTNASRTMLYNIHDLAWDDELLKIFDIPKEILPQVKSSSQVYGHTIIQDVKIPIASAVGDQQAALFGQCCFDEGDAKNTYGTGCFLLMNIGEKYVKSKNGLLTTIAIGLNDKIHYGIEGSVFVGGAVIQWLRDEMKFFDKSSDSEYHALQVDDTGGVYFVPAFTGLGAPHWNMDARGSILGITRGTTREHIIRAAQESIAYQSYDLVQAIESDTGVPIKKLKVDGGASRDAFLMQFQSDILNKEIYRPVIRETTALGASFLAGLATGVWENLDEIRKLWNVDVVFSPNMQEDKRKNLLKGWNKAVSRSLDWSERE